MKFYHNYVTCVHVADKCRRNFIANMHKKSITAVDLIDMTPSHQRSTIFISTFLSFAACREFDHPESQASRYYIRLGLGPCLRLGWGLYGSQVIHP